MHLPRLSHVNIVARDADALAAFYMEAFGLVFLRPPRLLSGERVSKGNGLPSSEIRSIWLQFPGDDGPFLEIHEYSNCLERQVPRVNEPGLGHLAFKIADIHSAMDTIIRAGGTRLGEVTNFGSTEEPILLVYMRDLEGNILELEQRRP